MVPPTSQKGVRNFIGVLKYKRDMWSRRSYTLAPLTKLTYINRKVNRRNSNKMLLKKLSGLWTAILYQLIQILMKLLKFIPMLARSN